MFVKSELAFADDGAAAQGRKSAQMMAQFDETIDPRIKTTEPND